MNKVFASILLLLLSFSPAFAEAPAKHSLRSENPAFSETAEIPSEVEIRVGQQVRRFRLIQGQEDGTPRTEEYVDPNSATPGIVAAPELSPVPGKRLERLGGIGDILVPLLAALLGASAGPKFSSILTLVWGALRNKQTAPSPAGPTSGANAVEGVVKIAEVLKRLAPVFSAIDQINKQTPTASSPDATVTSPSA